MSVLRGEANKENRMKIIMVSAIVMLACLSQVAAKKNVVEYEGEKIRFPKNMYQRMYGDKTTKPNKSPKQKEDKSVPKFDFIEELEEQMFDLRHTIPIPLYYDSVGDEEYGRLA
jgi:hypothetical protein